MRKLQAIFVSRLLFPILLILIGFWVFSRAIMFPLIHDDRLFVTQNPLITQWNVAAIWGSETAFQYSVDDQVVNRYYRPVLEIIYRILYQSFVNDPQGYHVVNILLHLMVSLMVYYILLRRFDLTNMTAFAGSMIFVLHPIQVESVACFSGISNTLFGLFGLTALYIYTSERLSFGRFVGMSFFLSLSLLTKEQAVIWPPLMIGYDVVIRRFRPASASMTTRLNRWMVLGWLVMLLLVGFYLFLRAKMTALDLPLSIGSLQEFYLRISAIPRMIVTYLRLLVVPNGLYYFRTLDIRGPFWIPLLSIVLTGLVMLRMTQSWTKHDRAMMFFGVFWFVVSLLPVMNIVPMIVESVFILTAEHFLYIPLIGFIICGIVLFNQFVLTWPVFKKWIYPVVTILLLSWTLRTTSQLSIWSSEVKLFENTVYYQPYIGRTRMLLADAYQKDQQFDSAFNQYQAANIIFRRYLEHLHTHPASHLYRSLILRNLTLMGQIKELFNEPQEALAIYKEVLTMKDQHALVNHRYGRLLMLSADPAQVPLGLEHLQKAVSLSDEPIVRYDLAVAYFQNQRFEEALEVLAVLLIDHPDWEAAKALQAHIKKTMP